MISIGELVRYKAEMFRPPSLSDKQERPWGWLKDDFAGDEAAWIGFVVVRDENMWGKGNLGYKVMWANGQSETVYEHEIEQLPLDKSE